MDILIKNLISMRNLLFILLALAFVIGVSVQAAVVLLWMIN